MAGVSEASRQEHWDEVYRTREEGEVSWYQRDPVTSYHLVREAAAACAGKDTAIVDAGGGASLLAARLADEGYSDVSVVDVSAAALATAAARPGGDRVTWITADLLSWRPDRAYQVWHDRAVFHFLTGASDRDAYLATLRAALRDGGAIVLGTFALDGPQQCSGLAVARYDPASLAAELAGAFGDSVTITGSSREEHTTPWGSVQPFTWVTAWLS
jgi:2-polyprenyl-3-methyl-5-hydroxy-6-metoxy-1,4-benzoquinol methylase